jgi:hypothetical protein
MMGHDVLCDICVGGGTGRGRRLAEGEEDGFDMPAPDDRLCRVCRKAVKDAREQRDYLNRLYGRHDTAHARQRPAHSHAHL